MFFLVVLLNQTIVAQNVCFLLSRVYMRAIIGVHHTRKRHEYKIHVLG